MQRKVNLPLLTIGPTVHGCLSFQHSSEHRPACYPLLLKRMRLRSWCGSVQSPGTSPKSCPDTGPHSVLSLLHVSCPCSSPGLAASPQPSLPGSCLTPNPVPSLSSISALSRGSPLPSLTCFCEDSVLAWLWWSLATYTHGLPSRWVTPHSTWPVTTETSSW